MEEVADKLVGLLDLIEIKVKDFPFPEITDNHLQVSLEEFNELLKANEELDKRIKEQVRETVKQKERFELIAKATQDAIWDWNIIANQIWWNEGFYTLFGYKNEAIEPGIESWYNRIHPEERQKVIDGIKNVIDSGGRQWSEEYRFRRSDGTYAYIFDRAYCLYDLAEKPVRMLGSMIDISERVRSEEALKASEARFRAMTDSMPQIIWSTRPDGYHDYYNQRWYDFVGKSKEETIGDGWNAQFHPNDQARAWKIWKHSLETGEPYEIEYRLRYKDGSYRWVLGRALPMRNQQGDIIRWCGTCTEIQKQKDTEEALTKSEDDFRTFANNIANLAWMANPDGLIFWYNQRWYEYTGTTLEEMLQGGWEKVHHPDHKERVLIFINEAWTKGENWELTYPLKGVDGKYRWFLTRAYAVKDEVGNVVRWIGTNTDIDNQKKAEATLAEKNKELIKINNDLDNFIYTASHDLRAPMSNLEGLFNTLITEIELENDQIPLKSMIEASFERFKNTIRDLTEITKVQKEDPEDLEVVNLSEILDEVLTGIKDQIQKYKAEIKSDFQVPEIEFSRKYLRSICYNLISNAIKYSAPDRRPIVTLSTTKDNEFTVFTISDNGLGISSQNRKKIFQMFKRLHDHVEGTGIGLYIVKRIVDNSGGRLDVESELGKGTSFRVYFPDGKQSKGIC